MFVIVKESKMKKKSLIAALSCGFLLIPVITYGVDSQPDGFGG